MGVPHTKAKNACWTENSVISQVSVRNYRFCVTSILLSTFGSHLHSCECYSASGSKNIFHFTFAFAGLQGRIIPTITFRTRHFALSTRSQKVNTVEQPIHDWCCGTLSSAFPRLPRAVTLDVRTEHKYGIRPQLGAIGQTETEREQTHNAKRAGNPTVKGESFVVPPVVPLSLFQGSFILGCWRGRYFVQYPTSATLATRMCVARTHAKCRFLRFGSSLCLPVDGPGFLGGSPEKRFLGKKTLGGTSKKKKKVFF